MTRGLRRQIIGWAAIKMESERAREARAVMCREGVRVLCAALRSMRRTRLVALVLCVARSLRVVVCAL